MKTIFIGWIDTKRKARACVWSSDMSDFPRGIEYVQESRKDGIEMRLFILDSKTELKTIRELISNLVN